MVTVRRWYVFLVCAVSLQSVTWAAIALFRNLLMLGRAAPVSAIAFQMAVVVIGLPLYLVHWLWAQRLAGHNPDERENAVRRLYLYGTLAGFLGPFAANAFDFVATLLRFAFGGIASVAYSPTDAVIHGLAAMVVLALLWFYHQRILMADVKAAPEVGNVAIVRRLYIFGFSATGVTMTTLAIIHLLSWIMFNFGSGMAISSDAIVGLTDEVALMIVGLPLWLVFWRWVQRLFTGAGEEERESALRKFYLYLVVFIAALTAVTNATLILAGFFRRLLALPSLGNIRTPLSIVIGMGVLWAYHAYVLQGDAALAGEEPRQAVIRRLYLYIVAAVGLAAFLVGLSGDISILIRSLAEQSFGDALKEQLAWYTAALIAGLPVWLLPWRQTQNQAVALSPDGVEERHSIVRKIYLYFYLFVATMTVLSGTVYIVYRLLSLALGERVEGSLLSDLGQAIAFSLIGVGVWLYHGSALRVDGQLAQRERAERLGRLRVAVVDTGEGSFGRAVLDGLRREFPGIVLDPIGLTQTAAETMGMDITINDQQASIRKRLAEAGLIVGTWEMAVSGGGGGSVTDDISGAVVASPARKLLIPLRAEGWDWAGVDWWDSEALVRQTVRAVKQIVEGEEIKPIRPLSAIAIIGTIIGVLFLLSLLFSVLNFFSNL